MKESADKTPTLSVPLVVGIGNILLRDEGVGVRIIEAMQRMDLLDVELHDGGTSGADLLDVIAERERVIVVDAVKTEAEPGAVFRFGPGELMQKTGSEVSLHEFGLAEALIAARNLGCAPQEVVIFGVQPKDISPGLELSPEIEAVLPKVIELVLAEVHRPVTAAT